MIIKYSAYIFILLFLSSCCKPKLIDTIRFDKSDLALNPYTGNEELIFVDDSNNFIIFNNGHREINEGKVSECFEGCCDYYFVETSDATLFKSDYMESDLQVTITDDFDIYTGIQQSPYLHFFWGYYEIKPYVTGTTFLGLAIDSIQSGAVDPERLYDSLTLRNTTFYNVFTFPGQCSYPDRLHGDTLFYSVNKGILGIRFSDGNLWVIQ